jgi:hypothetical protein
MFRRFTKKRVAILGVALGALALAVGAYAYLTTNGSGSGNATVISSTANAGKWTVAVTPDSTDALLPNSGTASLPFSITNASSGNEGLTNVNVSLATSGSGSSAVIEDSTGTPVAGCLASWFNVDGTSGSQTDTNAPVYTSSATQNSTTLVTLPDDLASGGVVYGTATITMSDFPVSQDACEGHTPKLTVSAS